MKLRTAFIITLAGLLIIGGVGATFVNNPASRGGLGHARWVRWLEGNYGDTTYVRVDSVAGRDTSETIVSQWFYEADSVKVCVYRYGSALADDDSSFVLCEYLADPFGTWAGVDTILKGANADGGDGTDTVFTTMARWHYGIRFIVIEIGTNKKPDSCQIVVTAVNDNAR